MRLWLKIGICVAIFAAAAARTPLQAASDYPNHPIRIVCASPAGGPQDALSRLLAQWLTQSLSKPVIVENRPGANTIIAAQDVVQAPADGYTLFLGSDATNSINPLLHTHLSYKADDFVPITLMVTIGQQLYVGDHVPAHSLAEFINYAKTKSGKLNYGTLGTGSTTYLALERFTHAAGIDMVPIHFKGSQDLLPALAEDQVQLTMITYSGAVAFLQNKSIRALAVSGPRRMTELPDVPTFAEAGYPQFNFKIWYGLMVRKGTPQDIVDLLGTETNKFLQSEEFRAVMAPRFGWDVIGGTQTEFADFLAVDRDSYQQVILNSHIQRLD